MRKKSSSKASFGINKLLFCLLCTSFSLIIFLWYIYVLKIKDRHPISNFPTDPIPMPSLPAVELSTGKDENKVQSSTDITVNKISQKIKELERLLAPKAKLPITKSALTATDSKDNSPISEKSTPKKEYKVQKPKKPQQPMSKSFRMHFVHIPKCGGTSMTALLRQVACVKDPERNQDCCTNPGFCDWHAMRRCSVIKGCVSHFPNRKTIFTPIPSITILREPVSRMISAWFYRGHSPNLDFFEVRPESKQIKMGLRPKLKFPEYLEMLEYHNIQTRMLGADSFPYRNITVTEEIFKNAEEALRAFFFVGLQEEYDLSVQLLLRKMNVTLDVMVGKEREQKSARLEKDKAEIKGNSQLMTRSKEVNTFDTRLYAVAVEIFCTELQGFPDLRAKLSGKVKCPDGE